MTDTDTRDLPPPLDVDINRVAPDADTTDGRVSVSVVESAGWLTVAGTTWRSGADLKSWTETA